MSLLPAPRTWPSIGGRPTHLPDTPTGFQLLIGVVTHGHQHHGIIRGMLQQENNHKGALVSNTGSPSQSYGKLNMSDLAIKTSEHN